jgi:hypothetical protein
LNQAKGDSDFRLGLITNLNAGWGLAGKEEKPEVEKSVRSWPSEGPRRRAEGSGSQDAAVDGAVSSVGGVGGEGRRQKLKDEGSVCGWVAQRDSGEAEAKTEGGTEAFRGCTEHQCVGEDGEGETWMRMVPGEHEGSEGWAQVL